MNLKPNDKCKRWNAQDAADRLSHCKAMLYVHGFLTEAENRRVQERILKWIGKNREGGVK